MNIVSSIFIGFISGLKLMSLLPHLNETGNQLWSNMLFMFGYATLMLIYGDKLLLFMEKFINKKS